jgi:hypothetical protein
MITSMQRMAPRAGGSADTVQAQVSSLNFVMYIPAMVGPAGLEPATTPL